MKRTLAEFGDLKPAEEKLLNDLPKGKPVKFGDAKLPPESPDPDRTIRAEFIRYLCLHANQETPGQTPETGVIVMGAQITGELNLHGAELAQDLILANCRIDSLVVAYNARLKNLSFQGSHMQGLKGDNLQAEGNVFLRGAEVAGEVWLRDAKLGGDLDCEGAKLTGTGKALLCDGLQAEGNVFLRGAEVAGEVRLRGAKLGGNLECDGAELGKLQASGADVTGSLFLRPVDGGTPTRIKGLLDLTGAKIGDINDVQNSWPKPGNLRLNRCIYGALTGHGITTTDRIRWLNLQNPSANNLDFSPQPWEYYAKLLRENGQLEDAQEVLIEKERQQRLHRQRGYIKAKRRMPALATAITSDLLRGLVAYGHRPLRALAYLGVLWLIGIGVFASAAAQDAIKPNNPFVLRSAEWYECFAGSHEPPRPPGARFTDGDYPSQLACFEAQPEARAYPTFRAGIYSADTLLPIVHLEMQEFWIPDGATAPGRAARSFLWLQIAAGWFLSLLAVAGFSGLIKSD